MSDLFHKDVPWEFVDQVFDAMEEANWHTFQISHEEEFLDEGLPAWTLWRGGWSSSHLVRCFR